MDKRISEKLKGGQEQHLVVGPLVDLLMSHGWKFGQIMFGKNEWKIPKKPSEASKRENGKSFECYQADIAVFDSVGACGDYRHLLFLVECKQPDSNVGLQQLEIYLSLEPYAKMGIWANNADTSSEALFIYKNTAGLSSPQKNTVGDLPLPGAELIPNAKKLTFGELLTPPKDILYKKFSDLLDIVVARDGNVTRREDQLDQLCDLILLKIDSDKQGKIDRNAEVYFRPFASEAMTGSWIRDRFAGFVEIYPDVFITQADKELRLEDATIHEAVKTISVLNLIDIGADTVSIAFQVLRSAALKQEEGQYFTPKQVIQAAIKLMDISLGDIIIDPACGTGGFLIQTLIETKEKYPMEDAEVSRWAQVHLFGIDKDAIGIKLTKAIMQILGDGSAHCVRGDSVLTHTWAEKYPHLLTNAFKNGRFDKVLTNPPFGAPLKVRYSDAKESGLSIASFVDPGKDIELGLAMFSRCCDLLKPKGKMCIVLPETYFFSPSYRYVRKWAREHLKPICVANVPMDAFQGFCRAKTNLYVFEKLDEGQHNLDIENDEVIFLDPQTCGIYKNGSDRYIVDATGKRTKDIDNELLRLSCGYAKNDCPESYRVKIRKVYEKDVLVPRYYDPVFQESFDALQKRIGFEEVSVGDLCDQNVISVLGGHGSPSNDIRNGCVPYVKVSDIRNMRINVNPTNLVALELAQRFWHTKDGRSNLKAWDLITPNRASSNIGEFAVLLPGEENIVLTKEVFVVRIKENSLGVTPFFLLWALSLAEVRKQWKRVTLMQTNREDVGMRYREILLPKPLSVEWAKKVSKPFEDYFKALADAKTSFIQNIKKDDFDYIANISAFSENQ